jgi:hypothetical protein
MSAVARPAFTCPAHAAEALAEAELRVERLLAEERSQPPEDTVAGVPGSGEPPD